MPAILKSLLREMKEGSPEGGQIKGLTASERIAEGNSKFNIGHRGHRVTNSPEGNSKTQT